MKKKDLILIFFHISLHFTLRIDEVIRSGLFEIISATTLLQDIEAVKWHQ